MDIKLVVVRPFGAYQRGDVVTDSVEVARVHDGEHAACVVRVSLPIASNTSTGSV